MARSLLDRSWGAPRGGPSRSSTTPGDRPRPDSPGRCRPRSRGRDGGSPTHRRRDRARDRRSIGVGRSAPPYELRMGRARSSRWALIALGRGRRSSRRTLARCSSASSATARCCAIARPVRPADASPRRWSTSSSVGGRRTWTRCDPELGCVGASPGVPPYAGSRAAALAELTRAIEAAVLLELSEPLRKRSRVHAALPRS